MPTSRYDQYPFSEEKLIHSVTDTTHLVLDTAPAITRTNVRYCISDLLDIDQNLLSSAFTMQCYYEIGKIRHLADRDVEEVRNQLDLAVKEAKSRSNPVQEISYAGTFSNLRRYAGVWFSINM